MGLAMFERYRTKVAYIISTAGESFSYTRAVEDTDANGNPVTDRYGGESTTWTAQGTITGVVFYGSRRREIRAEDSGRLRSDRPNLMVAADADLAEDDRVLIRGTEFRVDSMTPFPTHFECALRAVSP